MDRVIKERNQRRFIKVTSNKSFREYLSGYSLRGKFGILLLRVIGIMEYERNPDEK